MNLQNGYKVLFEKADGTTRTFYASKTGTFAEADWNTSVDLGKYKLIYEVDGKIYGSEEKVPTTADTCFDAFNAIFKASTTDTEPDEGADEGDEGNDEPEAVEPPDADPETVEDDEVITGAESGDDEPEANE